MVDLAQHPGDPPERRATGGDRQVVQQPLHPNAGEAGRHVDQRTFDRGGVQSTDHADVLGVEIPAAVHPHTLQVGPAGRSRRHGHHEGHPLDPVQVERRLVTGNRLGARCHQRPGDPRSAGNGRAHVEHRWMEPVDHAGPMGLQQPPTADADLPRLRRVERSGTGAGQFDETTEV